MKTFGLGLLAGVTLTLIVGAVMVFKHIGVARWDDQTTVEFIENLLRSTPHE